MKILKVCKRSLNLMAILQSFYLMHLRSLRVILNNEIIHILTFFKYLRCCFKPVKKISLLCHVICLIQAKPFFAKFVLELLA